VSAPPTPVSPVRLERRGPVALLWLDQPPVNVLSATVLDALSARLDEVERDPSSRVVVIASAQERAFAAGANIREMAPMGPAAARRHGGRGQRVTTRLERLPLPVLAAVHGVCVGGGCELALACDLIVASEDAVFGQPEINLGVMPGWGGTRRLPRRVGAARARWWIFGGDTVTAAEALAQGLLFRVVPRSELLPTAIRLAEELARKPALALAAAKYSINDALDPGRDTGLRYELALWSRLFGTVDQREGMEAFLAKRSPNFAGRTDWDRRSAGFPWRMPRAPPRARRASSRRSRRGKAKR
jgi:enoyl-CoA hydratase